MKICSVTMAPNHDAAGVKESRASVQDLVDDALVVGVGKISDFSSERNALLEVVGAAGFDWAIMLDTDERIVLPHRGGMTREFFAHELERSGADVIMVPHVSGTYEKERIFRLPAKGHYRGRTHEAWITDEGAKRVTTDAILFDEVPKTVESYRLKVERDRPLLEQMTREHPEDPRWWYYLGDTYEGLGLPADNAVAAFERCWILNGWDEESAWAAFRAASIVSRQGKHASALLWCMQGMLRRADYPEFPWLAGYSCYQLGRYEQAVHWAWRAINKGDETLSPRIGFRHPPAHYEGPWDVLRWSYQALGNEKSKEFAEEQFTEYLAARTTNARPT